MMPIPPNGDPPHVRTTQTDRAKAPTSATEDTVSRHKEVREPNEQDMLDFISEGNPNFQDI